MGSLVSTGSKSCFCVYTSSTAPTTASATTRTYIAHAAAEHEYEHEDAVTDANAAGVAARTDVASFVVTLSVVLGGCSAALWAPCVVAVE